MRFYNDPYITASSLTEGCSDQKENYNYTLCLGQTKQQQDIYGFIAISIGLVACIIELVV